MSLLSELRSAEAGASLLADWLGSGGEPVAPDLAERRALACTQGDGGRPCPLNVEPNWWGRVKSAIASAIKQEMELKQRLAIRVSCEGSLHMCAACGCCLPLKVQAPAKHIAAHLPANTISKTPVYCWMRKELNHA